MRRDLESLHTDCTASALETKTTIQELQGTANNLRTALDGFLAVLAPSLLTRDQQRCIRETFICCICRGDYVYLYLNSAFSSISITYLYAFYFCTLFQANALR